MLFRVKSLGTKQQPCRTVEDGFFLSGVHRGDPPNCEKPPPLLLKKKQSYPCSSKGFKASGVQSLRLWAWDVKRLI